MVNRAATLDDTTVGTVDIADWTVRRLGFGAMRISGARNAEGVRDREVARALVRRVVDRGMNLIDTANIYGYGESEEIIAEALHPYPADLLITTKAGFKPGKIAPGQTSLPPLGTPEHIREECEKSLRRLRVDAIDLYQVHVPDPAVPYEDTVGAFADLQREGKVRHIGVSNVSAEQLAVAQSICEVVTVENRYNVGDRASEAMVAQCEQQGIVFFPWQPVAPEDDGIRRALAVVAQAHGVSVQQVALAWLLAHSDIVVPIPGTTSIEHLDDNIDAAWLSLPTPISPTLDAAAGSTLKFTLQYPIAHAGYSPALLAADGMRKVVVAAEAAGFDSIAFTEHPAPSQKWMAGGGHESFDPLTALALCAGVTSDDFPPDLLVGPPYRNPFLAAKQVTTLDVMSGGRVIMSVGTGYLRSEFLALGVEFEERNALFDEALEVIGRSWSEDGVVYEGRHFSALGQTQRPRPPGPGPTIWIGGNGKVARQRAARHGQGWTPLLIGPDMAKTTRTAPLRTPDDLARAVEDLHELAAAEGRDGVQLDVQVEWRESSSITATPDHILERVEELSNAGATYMVVDPPGDDLERTVELIAAYGESVIAHA